MFRGAIEAIVGGVIDDIFWGDGLGAVPWLVILLCLLPFYRIIFGWILPGLFYFGIFLCRFCIYGLIPILGGICESCYRLYKLIEVKLSDGKSYAGYQGVDQGSSHEDFQENNEQFQEGRQKVRADSTAESRTNHNPFHEALTYVRMLEDTRARNGYRPGWLYYQCVDDPMRLEALYHLRDIGEIKSFAERSHEHDCHQQSARAENGHYGYTYDGSYDNTYDEYGNEYYGDDYEDESAYEGDFDDNSDKQSSYEAKDAFNPYSVLGIAKSATKHEIRTKYREQMMLYHPDKVAHLGDELKEFALRKAQDLQKAYEMLKS